MRAGVGAAAITTLALGLTGPAAATVTPRGDFALRFGTQTPNAPTSIHLQILYKAADPAAKPSPIRRVLISAPPGTHFDTKALPECTASDPELLIAGDGACPVASRLGIGKLTAITGFGPPLDPFVADVTIFNAADSIVELVKDHASGRPVATDRFRIEGSSWIGTPPMTPGGPPDGQTAVREIDFTYSPAAAWVRTPPSCDASGRWTSTASFTYADGVTANVSDATPCARPATSPP
ncbi:MAG: hypothetical protein M3155_08355, partial [Actinomycetota bacterium]|nr:hypothetical protein [Actinomycetota bacterium]